MNRSERLVFHNTSFGLTLAFFVVLAVMAGHESEHVAQIVQKDVLDNSCGAGDCRGLLGFIFDLEWVHFAYNVSILAALAVLYAACRMWRPQWRDAAPVPWLLLTGGVFVVQGYHVVEHAVKLDQWFEQGHKSPQPGLLGMHVSLIELHFAFNTAVFLFVLAGYVGLRLHGRLRPWLPAAAVVLPLALAPPIAWATRTPTTHLAAGIHQGPLLLDRTQKLVGEPGAIVRGGIRITANGVVVRDVAVVGGEHGIEIANAKGVVLDGVTVSGSALDGIHARRSSVTIRDCVVRALAGPSTQGIDISFGMTAGKSVVEGCTVSGGSEGITTHLAHAELRGNRVSGTRLRGIAVTEMSRGEIAGNEVADALGVAIFCGDYSLCEIEGNLVRGTRADTASAVQTRLGYAIQAHYGASASVGANTLVENARGMAAFLNAEIVRR